MIRKTGTLTEHDPVECPDCAKVSDGANVAIRTCQRGRDVSRRATERARAANPDVDAIHRIIEANRRA